MEYLDSLLLHRPDVLFDPEKVAEDFDTLESSGKVRFFGVSNLVPMQIKLLKKYVKQPLIFNQVQLSLEQSQLIDQALYMNNKTTEFSINRDGNALDNTGIISTDGNPVKAGFIPCLFFLKYTFCI